MGDGEIAWERQLLGVWPLKWVCAFFQVGLSGFEMITSLIYCYEWTDRLGSRYAHTSVTFGETGRPGMFGVREIEGKRTMRRLGGALTLFALMIGSFFSIHGATAQEATPIGGSTCAPLTHDEGVAIAEQYVAAVEAGDAATIDLLLADEIEHNLDVMTENVPGNDDEVAMYAALGPLDFTIEKVLVDGWDIAVLHTYSFLGGQITGESIVILTVQCGEIVKIHQESTSLGLLMASLDMATPVP